MALKVTRIAVGLEPAVQSNYVGIRVEYEDLSTSPPTPGEFHAEASAGDAQSGDALMDAIDHDAGVLGLPAIDWTK